MDLVEQGGDADGNVVDFKSGLPTQGQLPLARIKKVMKADDQVKMISAEAPILFARACEIFISDLTCRAFLIAEEHKRRTIQRSDIAGAIGRSDLFDFLIDIVPRHESVPSSRLPGGGAAKREKTGEGKGVGRASASRRPQQHQPPSQLQHSQDAGSYDDSVLRAVSGAYADAEGAASDSLNIPHTGVQVHRWTRRLAAAAWHTGSTTRHPPTSTRRSPTSVRTRTIRITRTTMPRHSRIRNTAPIARTSCTTTPIRTTLHFHMPAITRTTTTRRSTTSPPTPARPTASAPAAQTEAPGHTPFPDSPDCALPVSPLASSPVSFVQHLGLHSPGV